MVLSGRIKKISHADLRKFSVTLTCRKEELERHKNWVKVPENYFDKKEIDLIN
jgi:hypothetical protein